MGIKLSEFLVSMGRKDHYLQRVIGHWCPACEEIHTFACDEPQRNGAKWSWNGDAFFPTFNPSMLIRVGPFPDGRIEVCHYWLRSGAIEFLPDCTHDYKRITLPLPPIPLGRMSSILSRGS